MCLATLGSLAGIGNVAKILPSVAFLFFLRRGNATCVVHFRTTLLLRMNRRTMKRLYNVHPIKPPDF